MSINSLVIVGNIGKEIRQFGQPDRPVASLSVATTRSVRTDSGWTEETDWIGIRLFGQNAKFAIEHCGPGDTVSIEGRLRTSKFEKNGATQYVLEVAAEKFTLISSKKAARAAKAAAPQDGQPAAQPQRQAPAAAAPASADDEIPF